MDVEEEQEWESRGVGGGAKGPLVAAGFYSIWHFLLLPPLEPPFSFLSMAARVACSNTSRTPSFVFAEHSRYL